MALCFLLRIGLAVWVSSIREALAEERCESSFHPSLHSVARIKYDISSAKINKGKLYVVMKDGYAFQHLLSVQCKHFPQMYLEIQEEGIEDGPWTSLEVLKKSRHAKALTSDLKRGVVSLPKHLQIDLCKTYNIRFSMNDEKSPIIGFGPFDKELEAEAIENLPVDDEDILNVDYEEIEGGFIAKWDQICGRSFKIFLQEGEDEFKEVAQLEDVQPKTLNNSMKFPTKPCTKYTLQVESYWNTKPKESDGNLYDAADNPFFSSPDASNFGYIEMKSSKKMISWDLSSYRSGCASNIGYNIVLRSVEGEQLLLLREVEKVEEDGRRGMNISEEIEKLNRTDILEDLELYRVEMNMWYETAQGERGNKTFVGSLSNNLEGHFVEKMEGNALSLTDSALSRGSGISSNLEIMAVFFIIASRMVLQHTE